MEVLTKICSKCKQNKEISLFGKNNRDIIRSECNDCRHIYYINNRNIFLEKQKDYYISNKRKIINYQITYRKLNKEKVKKRTKLQIYNKRKSDINFRLIGNLRHRIWIALKENYKSKRTLELTGCTIEELKKYLQQTAISNGYTDFDIENFNGRDYHIDHIIPCSIFNLECSYHQKLCFNYKNLQILTAKENILKSNNYENN